MRLNLTFLVQIVNFYVTYRLLRILFFEPIKKSIDKKKQIIKDKKGLIRDREKELLEMQHKKRNRLLAFQNKNKKLIGKIGVRDIPIPKIPTVEISDEELVLTQKKIEKMMLEKVPNVD